MDGGYRNRPETEAAAQAVQIACATWMQVRDVADQTPVTINNHERR
jgi:hypothetical protein